MHILRKVINILARLLSSDRWSKAAPQNALISLTAPPAGTRATCLGVFAAVQIGSRITQIRIPSKRSQSDISLRDVLVLTDVGEPGLLATIL